VRILTILVFQVQLLLILCNFLAPRQNRPCLSLAFQQQEPNVLAMGFEKNKFDHCITIWDVGKGAPSEQSIINNLGLAESAHSMCWERKTLVAGMSQKTMKLFDLRQSPTAVTTATRAVNGVNISQNGRYLASYVDNIVSLFDIRKFSEPTNHFQLQNHRGRRRYGACSLHQENRCAIRDHRPEESHEFDTKHAEHQEPIARGNRLVSEYEKPTRRHGELQQQFNDSDGRNGARAECSGFRQMEQAVESGSE